MSPKTQSKPHPFDTKINHFVFATGKSVGYREAMLGTAGHLHCNSVLSFATRNNT